jgi:hypothetical protein
MATRRKSSSEEQKGQLIEALEIPFDPSMIEWKVVRRAQSGRRGALLPFADPRAYSDRLNQIFTAAGWSRTYTVATIPNLSRRLWDGTTMPTGKVVVTGTVTINLLGTHSGSGEAWADREHAVTAAEAQAFRRACASLGLGRYLYRFRLTWVSLNRYGDPITVPVLPEWALPPGYLPVHGRDARGPLDQRLTSAIEQFQDLLGQPIYTEILRRSAGTQEASLIPNANLQRTVLGWMQSAARGFDKARSLAETLGENSFMAVLDKLQINSMADISSLEALRCLVDLLASFVREEAA